jgi:hypothetical protein
MRADDGAPVIASFLPDDGPGPHCQSRFGAAPKPARQASTLAEKSSPPCHLRIVCNAAPNFPKEGETSCSSLTGGRSNNQ